jgi:hypothetical protein
MTAATFVRFTELSTPEEEHAYREAMVTAGYYAFFSFAEDFREALKRYGDAEIASMCERLAAGRRLFPHPGRFSPSWEELWDEFDAIYKAKNDALTAVPADARDGEWQVVIDNPHTPQQVVCYPGLSFLDASYMYAYFQRGLKPSEYLRLQKVSHLLVTNGDRAASIFPFE